MADEQPNVFPNLTPPPGGLEMLHKRLERGPDSNWMRWRIPALVVATVFICFAGWLISDQIRLRNKSIKITQALASLRSESHPVLVRFGLADPPAEAVTVPVGQHRHMAVQRVAVADPRVIYYRISMLDRK